MGVTFQSKAHQSEPRVFHHPAIPEWERPGKIRDPGHGIAPITEQCFNTYSIMLGFLLSRMWFVKIHGSDISIGNCTQKEKSHWWDIHICIKQRLNDVLNKVIAKRKTDKSMSVQWFVCHTTAVQYMYISFKVSSSILSPLV